VSSAAAQEVELFGANGGAPGRLLETNSGTLYLDEVTELFPEVKRDCCGSSRTASFARQAGTAPLKSDVRIIASTSTEPDAAVARGRFRQDLLHRLKS